MVNALTLAGTPLILVAAAVLLRNRGAALRRSVAATIFVVLTAWWMSGTHDPQSIWLNVPVIGGATFGSFFSAGLRPFERRPVLALAASLGAGLLGFFIGMVAAIELGLLRP